MELIGLGIAFVWGLLHEHCYKKIRKRRVLRVIMYKFRRHYLLYYFEFKD